MSGNAFRPTRLCRWRLRRRRLLVELSRVATLFKLGDSVVRDGVTLVLGQTFFQTANDLSGAPECESKSRTEALLPSSWVIRTYREQCYKPLYLARLPLGYAISLRGVGGSFHVWAVHRQSDLG